VPPTWDAGAAAPDAGGHDSAEPPPDAAQIADAAPKPPTSGWQWKSIYVFSDANTSGYSAEWDEIKAAGLSVTSGMAPLDPSVIQHIGAHTWALIPNGSSQADFQQWGVPACQTGLVDVMVIWDEPGSDAASITQLQARGQMVKTLCPGVRTAITGYDPGTLSALVTAHVADIYAVDNYPSRTGWDLSGPKACVAAVEQAGGEYTIVLDAFDAPSYPMPTAAQLQSEIDWARTTKALGVAVYAWGNAGGTPIAADADILNVLKAL
jgi:hypothetical protein